MADLNELKKKLAGAKPEIKAASKPDNESLKKGNKSKRGGKRANSGRKTLEKTIVNRGLKSMIDNYAKGDEEIEVEDPKTGLKRKIKKPRILWALETFFKFGMAQSAKQEVSGIQSLDKFMDRAVGKAAQPIRGEGEDDPPIKIGVDISDILKKAYGDKDEE